MRAKDKAKELVDRFLDVDDGIDYENGCGVTLYQAKQCALICVDEILDAVTTIADKRFDFYTKVKKEIEKL